MLLFIDIETVTETNNYLNYPKRKIWAERYCSEKVGTEEEWYYDRAPIHAEFAKIVCISVVARNTDRSIKKISFCGDDEKQILSDFFQLLDSAPTANFGGHNVKSFDIPFLCKRAIINSLKIPKVLDYGTYPAWKMDAVVDTMELRKRSAFLSTSLELIAVCLGLESPKGKMSGAEVSATYWRSFYNGIEQTHQIKLKEIAEYCEGDATTSLLIYEKICDPDKELIPATPGLFDAPTGNTKKAILTKETIEQLLTVDYCKNFASYEILLEKMQSEYEIAEEMLWVLKEERNKKSCGLPF